MDAKYSVFLLQLALIIGTFECYNSNVIINICENENMQLSCESSERIEILESFYGRKDNQICGRRPVSFPCFTNTTSFLRRQCNGLKSCSVKVTNENLYVDDPCYNIPKYLQVKAQCLGDGLDYSSESSKVTVYVCEDDKKIIKCPGYKTLFIKKAYYGRDNDRDGHVCQRGQDNFSYCSGKDVTQHFRNRCSHDADCELDADYTKLGDPCPGVFKYLKLEYSCGSQW